MDTSLLRSYALQIESDLTGNILPFWIRHLVDREHGGFFGELSNDLKVNPAAARGALLSTRVLWTYSAAYSRYRDPAHLAMARWACDDLQAHYLDPVHGGYYWSSDAQHRPLQTRKQIYGQAFAMYSLAEYHRATGLKEPLEAAIGIFRLVEEHARDRKNGGYLEAFSRDWSDLDDMRLGAGDMNEPKSQNTHLHVLEAYSNLLRVWPDPTLHHALADLIEIMTSRILDRRTHHLQLFFARDWTVKSSAVSFGHDIEASWLMTEAAESLGEALGPALRDEMIAIADATLREGIDADGAVFNEGRDGKITDSNKEWWPQAEAVVGFLNAHQLSRDDRFLDAALKCWDFIAARLIDHRNGEWYRGVTRGGDILDHEAKASFWKCPYHNGRACMEATSRLHSISAQRT